MRFIIFILVLSCSSKPSSIGRPLDVKDNKKISAQMKQNILYASDNIKLINKESANQALLNRSIDKQSTINASVAQDYIYQYKKALQADPTSPEYVQVDQKEKTFNEKFQSIWKKNKTPGGSGFKKNGVPLLFVKGNITTIQKLKNDENKMAFPSYMYEYFEPYYAKESNKTQQLALIEEKNQSIKEIVTYAIKNSSDLTQREKYIADDKFWRDFYGLAQDREDFSEEKVD